jgi:AraC family transcriptional regulator
MERMTDGVLRNPSRKPARVLAQASAAAESSRLQVAPGSLAFYALKPSRHLYGNLREDGMTAAWHNSSLNNLEQSPAEVARHACSLFLCLNLSGHGSLPSEDRGLAFAPNDAFLYEAVPDRMPLRRCEQQHSYVLIEFSACFLREQLGVCAQALHPGVRAFLDANPSWSELYPPTPLGDEHQHLLRQLLHAAEEGEQGQLRSKGILLQLMADFLLRPCCKQREEWSRKKSLASERTQKVVAILQRDLADPPTLEALGREVGCSPYYLSRTFSREMGVTMQQYMRTLRICHAAALLKQGRCNVTEAAMATGYSSLSHFSQAFFQTMGCCPTDYALEPRISEEKARASTLLRTLLLPGGAERLVSLAPMGSETAA